MHSWVEQDLFYSLKVEIFQGMSRSSFQPFLPFSVPFGVLENPLIPFNVPFHSAEHGSLKVFLRSRSNFRQLKRSRSRNIRSAQIATL